MSASRENPLTFRFRWMDEKGRSAGFLRKKGSFDGTVLHIDKLEIPAAALGTVAAKGERLIVGVPDGSDGVQGFGMVLASEKIAKRLKQTLDIARSAAWAGNHRKDLVNDGRRHDYRDATCPNCDATIILSGLPETAQVFCPFCQTLTFLTGNEDVRAGDYRICEACGMFSRPRKFTIVYVYFLIVFWGWRSWPTWRCPACMRTEAWKMIAGNLPFVVGLPVAITQLARAYGGGISGGPFGGLDAGNRSARRGDFSRAIVKYREILERQGHAAGVKYNLGIALLREDKQRAAEAFERSLEDCANYGPAYRRLSKLYKELGEHEKLARLQASWEYARQQAEAVS